MCWSLTDAASCFGADVLSAIDQAINDGVDIISVSAGGPSSTSSEEIFTDEVSIGAFHALARNILLVASAGNDGPTPGSVVNVAPWVFTVAASTLDRDFSSVMTIGNKTLTVLSLTNILIIFSLLFFSVTNYCCCYYHRIGINCLLFSFSFLILIGSQSFCKLAT